MSYDFYIEMDAGGPEPLRLDPDLGDIDYPARVLDVATAQAARRGGYRDSPGANYTSNVWRMFDEALGCNREDGGDDWRMISGKTCGDVVPRLERAVDDMLARPDHYRQWESGNGWGDYEGALLYLAGIEAYCRAYPMATLAISS